MTGSENPPVILHSDKLSTVTHHHLLTCVPVKLDIDNWNYAFWMYFFKNLYKGYEVLKYILGSSDEATTSTTIPPIPEELKVDTLVLSWILMTLSDTLQARLVMEDPQTAEEACDLIAEIFNDNKRSRTIALKAELRPLRLVDLSTDAYFQMIESIATILISLGSPVDCPKNTRVSHIITHRRPFSDLKTARSMLPTEEMRLKSKSQALPVDSSSSSLMFLLAESSNTRRSSTPQVKSSRPCYHFAKGSWWFGNTCKFVHDASMHAKSSNPSLWSSSSLINSSGS
uniref:Hybrid signal transduction histidine kinase M n=1 Tax=Tanacetum cinerariifolium TaxID=118510 RepID=A0A699HU12_TANCI|nr:hybrid signal transduction histidine kinase M [Tanacetum cinerariifolium]